MSRKQNDNAISEVPQNLEREFSGIDAAFDFVSEERQLESQTVPPCMRHERKEAKLLMEQALKREHLSAILREKPVPGTSLHIVGNGSFDFWTAVPILVELLGGVSAEFYGSTWTMNRQNVLSMFDLYDRGSIGSINMLTGVYFKRRESAVYATLLEGIQRRGQRFKCFENHAKIILLSAPASGDFITVEGSANFTANPRVEQYVFTNDRGLYDFHKAWMDAYLNE